MKRTISMLLLVALLLAAMPAQALTWFPEGYVLHRDPFCEHKGFDLDSCYEPSLDMPLTLVQSATDYLLCQHCCGLLPEEADVFVDRWYYNPDGGVRLHADPDCVTISKKYLPLTTWLTADDPAWTEYTLCNICSADSKVIGYPLDSILWNSTAAEKAALLPGVWTQPSKNAITQEEACRIAREHVRLYSSAEVHSALPMHYDLVSYRKNTRETWKVLVTTTLLHPICMVYIDALTGEVFTTRLSKEYSDAASDAAPNQLTAVSPAQVEITRPDVNFHQAADGRVLGNLSAGDVLTWLGEVRVGDAMWYNVTSPELGHGCVHAAYARPVHVGQVLGAAASPLTENLLDYCTALHRYQIETGFLMMTSSGRYVLSSEPSTYTDQALIDLARLMLAHTLVPPSQEAVVLTDPTANPADQIRAASAILRVHYGTDMLPEISTESMVCYAGVHPADWHTSLGYMPQEKERLEYVFRSVESSFQ